MHGILKVAWFLLCVCVCGGGGGGGGVVLNSQGEVNSHRLYSHTCDRSLSAVNGQSRSKVCSQRSKRAEKQRETANLGGVTCEVKCPRLKIRAVNGQITKKSWSRF